MKYRKKPVEIEAFRIGIDNIPDWAMDKVTNNEIILKSLTNGTHGPFEHTNDTFADIKTLEGTMRAKHGDYIIKGVNDEVYPCKPDIFEKTYEKVESKSQKPILKEANGAKYLFNNDKMIIVMDNEEYLNIGNGIMRIISNKEELPQWAKKLI